MSIETSARTAYRNSCERQQLESVQPGASAVFDFLKPAKVEALLSEENDFANFVVDSDSHDQISARIKDNDAWVKISTAQPILLELNQSLRLKKGLRSLEFTISSPVVEQPEKTGLTGRIGSLKGWILDKTNLLQQ